jgi:predicted DCC family thiol-disulfide oxidoreductase YuxK
VSAITNVLFPVFILALLGFHFAIMITMNLTHFIDQLLIFGLLLPWDTFYRRLLPTETMCVAYDKNSTSSAQTLYLFKKLDLGDCLSFQNYSDLEGRYREQVDPNQSVSVFADDRIYTGYDALKRLLRHLRLFIPVVWVLGLPVVDAFGRRFYQKA